MTRQYLIANWKMNLPPEGIDPYFSRVAAAERHGVNVVVAPPFPYLAETVTRGGDAIGIGAQNSSHERSGAFTGEVSPVMLRSLGVQYAIIGHSERRNVFHEPDGLIAQKVALALTEGVTPVLCIGEDLKARDAGRVATVLADQIKAIGAEGLRDPGGIVVAYEPIWAIGTGRNASGAMVAETVAEIRSAFGRFWPAGHDSGVSILYGGSVTPDNVGDLVANGTIDGFLVGGASLDSGKFTSILAAMKRS
jgi:triosephosphate isomerase (TIM)